MLKFLKSIIYTRTFSLFAYYLIRFYSMTFRLNLRNEKKWMSYLKAGRPVLLCAWHQQFFSAIRYFKTYNIYTPGIMISQSKDGELIASVARRTGWRTFRGSSSRGGKAAMEKMIDHLNGRGLGVHILDGPTGPIGRVKPGIIKMARKTNAVVIPFYIQASHAWFFNSWDRFMLPKPFSRVVITFDREISFPEDSSADSFEAQRLHLEKIMAHGLLVVP